ncbi:hypothetical protein C8J56DRAFT_755743, partial [Mycena floridula]
TIRIPARAESPSNDNESDVDSGEEKKTFCSPQYRDDIVRIIERAYCAHLLIPGYAAPNPAAIHEWATRKIYDFCITNELPEVWAYLWENWFHPGRWELWARSACTEIPIVKTTMILESHWHRIKHDFLHHFANPRVDLLVWVLVTKVAPCYYRKL